MEGIVDKSDGRIAYHSSIVMAGFGIFAEASKSKESYLIQFYNKGKIRYDRREGIFRIVHIKEDNEHDQLRFVIDLKNHKPGEPFHLNLSGLSKKLLDSGTCKKCKKYFEPLNHFEIVADVGTATEDWYKLINYNKTANNFIQKLEGLGFFKEFPDYYCHLIG
jgi:hypothetical protein